MKKFKIDQGIIAQKTGGKITIFDGEKSILYSFNDSASFIFNKIKMGKNKEIIIASMIKKYKIDKDTAQNDLEEFINDLKKRKIID